MQPNPLFCIVCGYERGGTTIVAELIRQHPGIDGRFECGFLLVDSMSEYLEQEIYARNLKIAWGLDQDDLEFICHSPSYTVAYQRLLERSNIPDKENRIYDKTPRYMRFLIEVLEKVDVPCICVVRDPRAIFWSVQKRVDMSDLQLEEQAETYYDLTKPTRTKIVRDIAQAYFERRRDRLNLEEFSEYYDLYAKGWQAANAKFPGRILLLQHEAVCTNPEVEARKIYDFLGLEFKVEYLSFPQKPDQYVDRGGILPDTVYEYKPLMPRWAQRYLAKLTKDYSAWHWRLPFWKMKQYRSAKIWDVNKG